MSAEKTRSHDAELVGREGEGNAGSVSPLGIRLELVEVHLSAAGEALQKRLLPERWWKFPAMKRLERWWKF